MKKLFLLLILSIISFSGFANFRSITIKDSLLQKRAVWDKTKLWVAKDMDKYNAKISYQNYDNGIMIIKGDYKKEDKGLSSEREGLLTLYVDYELEINCSDGQYSAKYNSISCRTKTGYANFSYMSDFMINVIKQELEVIVDIMREKGEKFEIDDDYFDSEYQKEKSLVEEAEKKKDDKTLKRSERKNHKRYYEKNRWKPTVYSEIKSVAFDLCYKTFYGGYKGEFNGLRGFIE